MGIPTSGKPKAERECDCCFMCGTRGGLKVLADEPKLHVKDCRNAWLKFAGRPSPLDKVTP